MMLSVPNQKDRPAEILLIEDNRGDVILTKKAFDTAKIANHITVVNNGMEALALLRKEGQYADAVKPDIILLDLNLPKKNGRAVLKEIKSDSLLRRIPVIILTSSRASSDVAASYDLHANGYIVKPVNLDQFSEIVETVENFWFSSVVLPNEDPLDATDSPS